MSQFLKAFIEVRRDGRWHLAPKLDLQQVDDNRMLQALLTSLFHGVRIDESSLQLDTRLGPRWEHMVDEAHLREVLREHPEWMPEEPNPAAFQLDYATLKGFEWSRRLKWLHSLPPWELKFGTHDPVTRTWTPARLEDFLVTDAAGVERLAGGDARIAADAARELSAGVYPLLTDFPTVYRTLHPYDPKYRGSSDHRRHYLLYRSYAELFAYADFPWWLLSAMERLLPSADEPRPENVRLVFWTE
jgi:hypothetical protein